MTREIKFRGKSAGVWHYGHLFAYQEDVNSGTGSHFIIEQNGKEKPKPVQVIPDTVGQFTGLHDKNGKEIYEGDILHVIAETDDTHDYITQVSTNGFYEVDLVGCEYDLTILAWLSASYDECCTIEVIGNIYDNPELLKGDQQ